MKLQPMGRSYETSWRTLQQFSFGDSAALANELAELVLEGKKRATCWAAVNSANLTSVGQRWVMLDGLGSPRAILETAELVERRFGDVDENFAFDEGEGDRTLAYWRTAHRLYFERQGTFSPNMLLCCERFRLIEPIEAN